MSCTYRIRTLTQAEHEYFCEKVINQKSVLLAPMSIMGPEDHVWIKHLQTYARTKEYGIYSGDGHYYNLDVLPMAKGGETIPFGLCEFSLFCLLGEARSLDIHVYDTDPWHRIIHFETRYTDAIIEIVRYANSVMDEWRDKRNVVARWFGAPYPEANSKEKKAIQEHMRRILMKTKQK